MKLRTVQFNSGAFQLAGVLHLPDMEKSALPAVIVCHPHPLYGGEMENNVVYAICNSLVKKNIIAMRFNFRTVYNPGEFNDGFPEVEDLKSALKYLLSLPGIDVNRIAVSGYSFGGNIALRVVPGEPGFEAIAAVSPPMDSNIVEGLVNYSKPKLFVCGSSDQFVAVELLRKNVEMMPDPKSLEIVEGADHFWWGYDDEVGKRVARFFEGLHK